jgi:hypothetical protein
MKSDTSMGWAVDVIDPRRLSSLMLAKFELILMKSSRKKKSFHSEFLFIFTMPLVTHPKMETIGNRGILEC